jgi:pimeloyl-ACP methyl ester carboxylesterase
MRRRAVGMVAFAGAAVGGAALGYLAERRTIGDQTARSDDGLVPVTGRPFPVYSSDGTRLHAEVDGPQDGPTIVLAHGVGLSAATWHYQRAALTDRFRVVAYDHRGHGGSERAEDCSVEVLGHDLAAVIEQCGATGPVVLAGHSMGGMAVLSLAEHHPGLVERRVAGAVLCNTTSAALIGGAVASSAAAVLGITQARLAGSRLGARTLLRSQDPAARPSTDLSFLLTRQFGMTGEASPEIVAFVERQLRSCPPVVLAAFAPGLATVNLREAAASLQQPTLVVVGGRDRITLPRQGRRLAQELPYAKLLELDEIGHTAMLEDPDTVTEAIRSFAETALAQKAT